MPDWLDTGVARGPEAAVPAQDRARALPDAQPLLGDSSRHRWHVALRVAGYPGRSYGWDLWCPPEGKKTQRPAGRLVPGKVTLHIPSRWSSGPDRGRRLLIGGFCRKRNIGIAEKRREQSGGPRNRLQVPWRQTEPPSPGRLMASSRGRSQRCSHYGHLWRLGLRATHLAFCVPSA